MVGDILLRFMTAEVSGVVVGDILLRFVTADVSGFVVGDIFEVRDR